MHDLPLEMLEVCGQKARQFAGMCLVKAAQTGVQLATAYATFGGDHAVSRATEQQYDDEKKVAESAEIVARAWEAEYRRRVEAEPKEAGQSPSDTVAAWLYRYSQNPERN